MHKNRFISLLLTSFSGGLILINTVQAGIPTWTFAPVSGYPSSVSVNDTGSATIKYTVTNQSSKSHLIQMRPIPGIISSGCSSVLQYHQSCTLTLAVNGSTLKGNVFGGPVLCNRSNPNQCYQPSQEHSLAIQLIKKPPIQQYTITSSAGTDGSISPNGTQTVNAGTTLSFTAIPNTGYGVNQWLVDGNIVQTGGSAYDMTNISANHSVNVTFGTVTLTPSVSMMGLSVNCPASSTCNPKNDALTGTPRTITITNTGSVNATNVIVNPVGLPLDASVSPSSCGTITANGGTCTITVTPGETASGNVTNTPCSFGVQPGGYVRITADGGLSTSIDTYVLSYGCIYEGGFIYSIDDTTINTGSIGGKVAAVTDTYPGQTSTVVGIPDWGGNGTDIGSNLYNTSPQGANNGSANSQAIITTLTSMGISPTDYAAGLCNALSVDGSGSTSCTSPNICYVNWYLPAICELAPYGVICATGSTNIQEQLFDNTLIPTATLGLVNAGFYWSSTEGSGSPSLLAMAEIFNTAGSTQSPYTKADRLGIRCSRILTP